MKGKLGRRRRESDELKIRERFLIYKLTPTMPLIVTAVMHSCTVALSCNRFGQYYITAVVLSHVRLLGQTRIATSMHTQHLVMPVH